MFERYERIYEKNKKQGTIYTIGYMKIVVAIWLIVIGLIVIWFKTLIGLGILFSGFCFWAWGMIQKRLHIRGLEAKLIADGRNRPGDSNEGWKT